MSQDRMPPIPQDRYTKAQKQAADEFLALRKTSVFGPFVPLLRSPEVMTRAQQLGEYLRYRNSIGPKLSEFIILLTAREWSQDYEWSLHYPIALQAGLKAEIADAVLEGRRPEAMAEDEEAIYEFVTELQRTKRVSDRTFDRAVSRFGEQGVIDIIATQGYYALLAMTMNVTRPELPESATKLPRFP